MAYEPGDCTFTPLIEQEAKNMSTTPTVSFASPLKRRHRRILGLMGAAFLAIVLGLGGWLWVAMSSDKPATPSSATANMQTKSPSPAPSRSVPVKKGSPPPASQGIEPASPVPTEQTRAPEHSQVLKAAVQPQPATPTKPVSIIISLNEACNEAYAGSHAFNTSVLDDVQCTFGQSKTEPLGMDIDGYCGSTGSQFVTTPRREWHCADGRTVDLSSLCSQQFGTTTWTDFDTSDKKGWGYKCTKTTLIATGNLADNNGTGGLNGYCSRRGYTQAKITNGRWICV